MSLATKIVTFFDYNVEEELEIQDVMAKWGVGYATAQKALYRLVRAGWLSRREVGRASVYGLNRQALSRRVEHGPGCWSWGPAHYMCAYREVKRLGG